jgi:hypothetical protein
MGKDSNQVGGYEIESDSPKTIAAAIGGLASVPPKIFEAMAAHAEFTIEKETPEYIYILDTGYTHTRTITNDPEFVIRELINKYALGDRKIFYRDSEGTIDEIVHAGGRFLKYSPGHAGYDITE